MANNELQAKLELLAKEQEERVNQVTQIQEQIQQAQATVAALKEQHDHTRGKMDMLSELVAAEDVSTTDAKKDKK
jgi:chromosome segregation ATPase